MINLVRKCTMLCMVIVMPLSGTFAGAEVSDRDRGRHHDLLPFLTAPLLAIWWGGGTAVIAGQSKHLDISTELSPVWLPGNIISNKVNVTTTLKLAGFAEKNVEYTMSFKDEHEFSIVAAGTIIGSGSCFAESDYDVTCDFEIPSLHHKEVFHFYQEFQRDWSSRLSISAKGTTDLWGPTALLEYKL